ncbi:hybrid sensor histidine kinase/response regulator [Alkalimarinus coralli]|nr:hybrid sensor histidine kinase/response regulator [Alkalimarinus coralli]
MSRWIKGLNEEDVKRDLAQGFRNLRFLPAIEKVYQQYYYQWLTKRSRPVGWISLAIFLSYSVLDYQLFPDFVSQWTISIRLFFICPLILILIWLSYQPVKPRLFFALYSGCYFLSGLAVIAIIMSARLQQVYMPYDGLLLLLMYGYFVMRVPFLGAISTSWFIFLLYLAGIHIAEVSQQELVYNSFFLITANIIGGVGSYLQEHSQRTHFLGQLLLEFSHAKAERESEQKTKLVATASHELRQPLHAMNLLAENLSTRLSEDGQRDTMGRLQLSITQLQDLLGSLFDISRLSVGVIKPRNKNVACDELLHMLVTEYQPRCEAAGIQLEIREEANVWAYTDPLLLTRILRNLLENAVKHSQATQVIISLRKSGAGKEERVDILVIDDGIGIAKSEQSNVFKEFNSLARHGSGLGVGLAVVKQLAEILGGELSLTSSQHQGCQFSLRLPVGRIIAQEISSKHGKALAKPAQRPFCQEQRPNQRKRCKQLTIIDDDPEILNSMSSLVKGWSYQVAAFSSPDQALKAAKEHETREALGQTIVPDVIIADYQYLNATNTNGIELIRQLRQCYGVQIPALLLSASTELDLESGVDGDILVAYKPLKPAKLKLILSHLLDIKHQYTVADEAPDGDPEAIVTSPV